MSSEKYKNLLHDNIKKTYQKAVVNTKRSIGKESKRFAKLQMIRWNVILTKTLLLIS